MSPSAYCDNAQAFVTANASQLAQCLATDAGSAGSPAVVVTCTSVLQSASCTASDQSLLALEGANLPTETSCVNALAPNPSDGGVDCLVELEAEEAACQTPSEYDLDAGLYLSSECQDALATINTYP